MGQDKSKWSALADKELRNKSAEDLTWKTLEGIEVSPIYTQEDLSNLEHLGTLPGQEPFTRGVKATMYACLLYTSPSPRDLSTSRMPSSA